MDFIDEEGRLFTYKSSLLFPPHKKAKASLKHKESAKSLNPIQKEKKAELDGGKQKKSNSKPRVFEEKMKEKNCAAGGGVVRLQKKRKS